MTPLLWESSLTSSSILCAGLLIVIYVFTAVGAWYPLRRLPTPSFWAKFSYLWLAKTTWSGRQYWVYRDLHTKYGPLVRIGPYEIHTDDPDILRQLTGSRSSSRKSDWYLGARFNPRHDNILSTLDTEAHAKLKRRTAPAYSGREVPDLEAAIDSQILIMVDLVRGKCAMAEAGRPVVLDLCALAGYFSMDVITRLGFGKEIGYLRDETDHFQFHQSLQRAWPYLTISTDISWIRRVLFSRVGLKLLGPRSSDRRGLGPLMTVGEYCVRNRFAGNEHMNDMLGSFIRHGLTQQQCEVETLFMLVAGSETTSSALRSTLLHLITTPRVYAKLKEEIRTMIRKGVVSYPIQYEEVKQCPYLQAVLYEGLRSRPPLLGLFPKRVRKGGEVMHGIHIPEGTAICTNISSLLRSQALFGEDSHVFRPERFLEAEPKRCAEMERNTELVFGSGQFMCLGKTIAFMELSKAVFELMRAFDLQVVNPGNPCDVKSFGAFVEKDLFVDFKLDLAMRNDAVSGV
ncbi:BcABA1, cytochrome P450 monooxygenase [Talaromyces proteolyticus]|uniref:BcABA1, cytochrome P450 monooxygenase n=1 Tax=Talaromyces proteolyticus TaxID=1131652 RepID=A0AAD4KHU0_9EURO|nr:BcABA1, cytochrome P450 monooxygenase [Talaromyces proteolyticus]KAH8688780.1 BcABA1, cytochrome P450 monooxygenase [Talaromyces proteolyticus]